MRKAVYAGSFDPITLGHEWIIQQAAPLFDQLVVAIGVNPDKRPTFTVEERLGLIRETTSGIATCTVAAFENKYLVAFADQIGAGYVVRGIRNESDFTYERAMRHINSDLRPEVLTVFLIPPRQLAELSSSMVKGMVGPEGWESIVQRCVSPCVFQALKTVHGGHRA
jgi:pantetheine-phosphate adenylyltransferase